MKKVLWIEKNWGGSLNDISAEDFVGTLGQIMKTQHSGAAFWMGCSDGEYVLKIEKNLNLTFICGKNLDLELTVKTACWEDIHSLGILFIRGEFKLLEDLMEITKKAPPLPLTLN